MLSKRYKSNEVDFRTWLHVPSGTPWSTSSDTHQVVEIQKECKEVRKQFIKVNNWVYLKNRALKDQSVVFFYSGLISALLGPKNII